MSARRVVDRIASASRSAPFESDELPDESGVIEELHTAGVQNGEQLSVEIPLGAIGERVLNTVHAKSLAGPFSRISITGHLTHVVSLQDVAELGDDVLGRKRRTPIADRVEHHTLAVAVCNGERH